MSGSKKDVKKENQESESVVAEVNAAEGSLKERIKELEAKIREGEERALARVCAALDIDPSRVTDKEQEKRDEKWVRMFVNYPVIVNGKKFEGDVTVPYGTFQVISQSLGDRRMRILNELTGSNYILKELAGGIFAPHLVGKHQMEGAQ